MALCEMCGKQGNLVIAEVEGVELKVCPLCAKHGIIKSKSSQFSSRFSKDSSFKKEEMEEKVVPYYARLIKEAREQRGLNQEDFARFLNEKVSITSKWESGSMSPNIESAKRLQRILNVSLIMREEQGEEIKQDKRRPGDDTLTLGDFIKIKKRS
ncbi:MAG: multiprotein bridging factor aMBF1 [Candidatus Woesearchaeota archaeon]|jgi:putative transcription factor